MFYKNQTKPNLLHEQQSTMTHLDFLKKFKRFTPLEPSLGIITFFFIALLFIGCFFYLGGVRSRGTTLISVHFPSSSASASPDPVEFLGQDGDGCDVFDGNWVWDETYPLYHSANCSFLDQGFRCSENGRPDAFYTKWRWQPKDCNLPRGTAVVLCDHSEGTARGSMPVRDGQDQRWRREIGVCVVVVAGAGVCELFFFLCSYCLCLGKMMFWWLEFLRIDDEN